MKIPTRGENPHQPRFLVLTKRNSVHGAGAPSPPSEGAKVDACIKDLSRQTEGEIHQVCAKAVGIDGHKTKITSV